MKNYIGLFLVFVLIVGGAIYSILSLSSTVNKLTVQNKVLAVKRDSLNRIIILSKFYTIQSRKIWGSKGNDCLPSDIVMVDSLVTKYGKGLISTPTVLSLITEESGFKPKIISYAGAIGLTQLLPSTGKKYGLISEGDFTTPNKNIRVGIEYLVSLIKFFDGDKELAILAYNQGPGIVKNSIINGISLNRSYYNSILEHNYLYAELKEDL